MSILIRIPTPLRTLTGGASEVALEGTSLEDLIHRLEERFPGTRERLCDEKGQLRRFINIYVNGEDVRFLEGLATALRTGDEVSIVPAVAGGSEG